MKANGLYVSPTEFVRFAQGGSPLAGEIATRSRSLEGFALGLGLVLPNPDPILKKQGRDISAYTDLRSDAHVGGCIRRRKSAVQALEWRVEPGRASARSTKLARAVLEGLDMRALLHDAMEAVLYGWQPLEVLWSAPGAGPVVPLAVQAKPLRWFTFDALGQLRFKSREQPLWGEVLPPRKFLLAVQDASYDNPYGFADLSMCFWPVVFKRRGLRFWVTFAEKFGTPWVVGKTPRGTPAPEQDLLLDQLEAMVQDAVAVVPDDASVEVVEAAGKSASADLYERLLMFCRSEVAIALLGQNQTTEASVNKASATAGLKVTDDLRDGDARLVEAVVNQLLRWVVDANEGEAAPAPTFELFEQAEINDLQASRDKLLVDAGLRLTPAYWARVYALEDGDIDTAAMASASAPATPPTTVPAAMGSDPNLSSKSGSDPIPLQGAGAPGPAFAMGSATAMGSGPIPADPTAALAGTLQGAGDAVLAHWMAQIAQLVQAAPSPGPCKTRCWPPLATCPLSS
jgi:phage gp29-like protein